MKYVLTSQWQGRYWTVNDCKNLTTLKRFKVSEYADGNEIGPNVYKQIICVYARAYKYAEQQYCLYNAHKDFIVSSKNVQ